MICRFNALMDPSLPENSSEKNVVLPRGGDAAPPKAATLRAAIPSRGRLVRCLGGVMGIAAAHLVAIFFDPALDVIAIVGDVRAGPVSMELACSDGPAVVCLKSLFPECRPATIWKL